MDRAGNPVTAGMPAHTLLLELHADGHSWCATPNKRWSIGRGANCEVRLNHPRVSRNHATLEPTPDGWFLVNHGGNGIYVDGHRVERVPVQHPITVWLSSPPEGAMLQLRPKPIAPEADTPSGRQPAPHDPAVSQRPSAVYHIDLPAIRIGRAPDNHVVLEDLLVSRHHAELRRTGNQWELVDLGSANGTYVNGARIARAMIGPRDIVGVGHQRLHLAGDRIEEYVDTGDVSFEASGLTVVTKKGRVLLADISFALPNRGLLAVIGPTGAGKSTLMGALTGFRPATMGQVHYAGRDLYANYAELRHRIGFVPQDDILHTQLTVRRALTYAARLRFPQEVSVAEMRRRIEEVLAELGLSAQADQRISSLSGGQRKRTSVALELLTKPSLLFLDEPTSGLDPGYDKSVMQTLRDLANGGRSVVVVTHNVAQLNMCDRLLILAPGGRLAYFGPPQDALSYFNCADFPDLFTLLERSTTTDWKAHFAASPFYERYIRSASQSAARPPAYAPPSAPQQPVAQQSTLAQFAILCRRYLSVIAADRQYSIFQLALPLVLSVFAHFAPGRAGMSVSAAIDQHSSQPRQLLLLLIVEGALMGCAASVREIVKEQAIYRREHGIGLSRVAYLCSKLVVLSVLTGLQGLVLALLGTLGLPGPDDPLLIHPGKIEIAAAVIAVTVVSMIIGLLISAVIDNADRGMPLLVLVVIAELVFSSGLFPVHDRPPLEQLSWLSPSRWAYAMGAATANLNALPGTSPPDPLWRHEVSTWLAALGLCGALGVFMVILLVPLLGRLDPQRKRGP